MPTGIDNLNVSYSSQDYDDVATNDDIRVAQIATDDYAIHQFKDYIGSDNKATLTWEGQSDLAPSSSTTYLQIYNLDTISWETLDSDNISDVNIDFTLTSQIVDLTNYKDGNNVIVCRVYQQAV